MFLKSRVVKELLKSRELRWMNGEPRKLSRTRRTALMTGSTATDGQVYWGSQGGETWERRERRRRSTEEYRIWSRKGLLVCGTKRGEFCKS